MRAESINDSKDPRAAANTHTHMHAVNTGRSVASPRKDPAPRQPGRLRSLERF